MANQNPFNSPKAALAFLKQVGIPWFDDNPNAWQSWRTLAFSQAPSQWDLVSLANYGPFLCERVDGGYATKLDVKEQISGSAAILTDNGQRNSNIDMTLWLPTPIDLASYIMALRKILVLANAQKATPVSHPALLAYGMRSIYLYRADLIQPPRDERPPQVRLEFHQFRLQFIKADALTTAPLTPGSSDNNTIMGPTSVNAPPPTRPDVLVDPTTTVSPPSAVA